jgi:hypothetical protein
LTGSTGATAAGPRRQRENRLPQFLDFFLQLAKARDRFTRALVDSTHVGGDGADRQSLVGEVLLETVVERIHSRAQRLGGLGQRLREVRNRQHRFDLLRLQDAQLGGHLHVRPLFAVLGTGGPGDEHAPHGNQNVFHDAQFDVITKWPRRFFA